MASRDRELATKLRALRRKALNEIEGAMIAYPDDLISLRNQAGACLAIYASKRAALLDEYCRRLMGTAR
jgi:hypothetical protein